MIESFFQVLTQVGVLFVLVAVGFLLGKARLIGEKAAKDMANVVLYLATPGAIIVSFEREYDASMMKQLLLMMGLTAAAHIAMILVSRAVFPAKGAARQNRIYRFATVFSNCGYMCLPLQQALLGNDGVFFGAAYVAIFNLFVWTYGLLDISGDKRELSGKKILTNPGIIGLVVGVIVFVLSLKLPTVIASPIQHLANLNTPIPMMLVGYHLSQSNLLPALKNGRNYLCTALRLLICPAAILAILYICGIRGALLETLSISLCAPVAAVTTMFASKYEQDVTLSVQLVSMTTVLSAVTMPFIITLTRMVA